MDQTPQTAILLISDSLFREGLKLLLEDMNFIVSSSGSYLEIEKFLYTCTDAPSLFVFPLILNNDKSSFEFVRKMRNRFKSCIPVVLLRPDNTVFQPQLIDEFLIILPEQVRPNVLRQKINEVTHNKQLLTV